MAFVWRLVGGKTHVTVYSPGHFVEGKGTYRIVERPYSVGQFEGEYVELPFRLEISAFVGQEPFTVVVVVQLS